MIRATSALHLSLLAAAALAAAACSDPLPSVPERTIAYTVLATQQNVAGDAYVLRPTALFFRTNSLNLVSSANAPDQCVDRAYAPHSPAVADTFPAVTYLNAGESVALETNAGTTSTLIATTDAYGKSYYAPAANASVAPFTPGDVVTLTVPGGGTATNAFPATTLSQTTVTPFTAGDVATSSNDPEGLKITWSAPPTPPSGVVPTGMLVSLRYASFGTGAANREVFCSLVDDGSYVIPVDVAAGWFKSLPNGHDILFTRWRADVVQSGNIYTSVVSTITVPTATVH
jgi:hypothetical protein